MNDRDPSEDEMKEIVLAISKPVFKYAVKRLTKKILDNKKFNSMSLNSFLSIMTAVMAITDANILRFLENFYTMRTKESLDFDKLKAVFIRNLERELKVLLH